MQRFGWIIAILLAVVLIQFVNVVGLMLISIGAAMVIPIVYYMYRNNQNR